ncbi:MAG TPA: hypothetical protein VH475_10150 [Tepidisphaeraceae bacterium]
MTNDAEAIPLDTRLDQMDRAISSLQRSRRRWRTFSTLLAVSGLACLVLGAKEKLESPEFQTVTTKELRVTDDAGKVIFYVSNTKGVSILSLNSSQPIDGGSVYLAAKRDEASMYVNGGSRHSVGMFSSLAHNFLDLNTRTAETVLINGGEDAGAIVLSKTPDGKKKEKIWSAP